LNSDDIAFLKTFTPERINQFSEPDVIYRFLGILESALTEINELKQEVQSLRDEVNHLKGEQGKPNIRGKKIRPTDISSEKERAKPNTSPKKGRQSRNHNIKITRQEMCRVKPGILPSDAIFKGYTSVIVQDLKIEQDNIEFQIEHYYSPSTRLTYSGERPYGYEGEFGPNIKALIIGLKYGCNMSEPSIESFLTHHGVFISKSTISRYLTHNLDQFHEEKDEVTYSGLISTQYQQLDDTGARVNGEQWATQILCNPYYTSYHTIPHKDRLSILKLLLGPFELQFEFNDCTFELLKELKQSSAIIEYLKNTCNGIVLSENELDKILNNLPTKNKSIETIHRRIKEAAGIAWYHNQDKWPIVEILLTDDAPQFDHLAFNHALCWIHAGRSLKKLNPLTPAYQEMVKEKLDQFWQYYHQLAEYREFPKKKSKQILEKKFDTIFNQKTGYQSLDDKLTAIAKNKEKLLLVLKYPNIPLHNNESERGARAQVRKRDVSLHTITREGTKALDTFLSLKETTKKCGINFFEYLYDRLTKENTVQRLGEVILRKVGIHSSGGDVTFKSLSTFVNVSAM
jgi:hypothetical protein